MSIKFQYNKTALQQLNKQLKVRERALPTLKNKESALRLEVKKAKNSAVRLDLELQSQMKQFEFMNGLWNEFDQSLITIEDVILSEKKIAGVRTPILDDIKFKLKEFVLFNTPSWYLDGVQILKELARIGIEREIFFAKMSLLDYARRKTTQKVNLYEKVQIPGYKDAVLKIKRFLEDAENLSKAAQKIVKKRQEAEK